MLQATVIGDRVKLWQACTDFANTEQPNYVLSHTDSM